MTDKTKIELRQENGLAIGAGITPRQTKAKKAGKMKAYNESVRPKLAALTGRTQAAKPSQIQAGQSIQADNIGPLDMLAEERLDHMVADHVDQAVPGLGIAMEMLKTLSDAQTSQPAVASQQAADDQRQRILQMQRTI